MKKDIVDILYEANVREWKQVEEIMLSIKKIVEGKKRKGVGYYNENTEYNEGISDIAKLFDVK